MGLADNIIKLRKQAGMSQEDLANQLNVSRQAVSKWESGNAVADLDKIIKMSEIFNVSVDLLLKEDAEIVMNDGSDKAANNLRRVSDEEAQEFMEQCTANCSKLAMAIQLFILSPVVLITLAALSEKPQYGVSEELAAAGGVTILLAIVALGVAKVVNIGIKLKRFDYLKSENIAISASMTLKVSENKKAYEESYCQGTVYGIVLCIISALPLLISSGFNNGTLSAICVSILLIIVSFGVRMLIKVSVINDSYKILLQEDNFSLQAKHYEKQTAVFAPIYWCSITAIFLGISFYFDNWQRSWIIWPVAGVAFAAIRGIMLIIMNSKQD